jgi:hypothetical protein
MMEHANQEVKQRDPLHAHPPRSTHTPLAPHTPLAASRTPSKPNQEFLVTCKQVKILFDAAWGFYYLPPPCS